MTPDPKPASPKPDDDEPSSSPDVFGDDDESIDLNHPGGADEGASALSFSGRSGPRSGGPPSSHVRSWEQLKSDVDVVHYGTPTPTDDTEAASDKDLLRQVLADEPPPSDIVLKDPSQTEFTLPPSGEAPSSPFVIPGDPRASRPDDSSILSSSVPPVPGQSGLISDVFGSSSRVDLLRPGAAANQSSGSLQRTEEMDDPRFVGPPSGDSGQALLGTPSGDDVHDESSAVNLGAHGVIDLPFGLDSTVESTRMGPNRKPEPQAYEPGPESGAVDLRATGVDEFDLGLVDSNATPSWAAARADLPPTVPMVPAKARLAAWVGGGAAGLLAGVAVCVGLWFAVLAPNPTAKPTTTATATPDLGDWQARVQAATAARDEEVKKSAAATADAQRVRDQLAQVSVQLTQAKSAAAQAKQARDRADALAAQVKQAEVAQAELKDSLEKLIAGKATADGKLREVDANLAAMRDRLARAEADAKSAKDRSEVAEAARTQSAALVAHLAQRLRVAPTAPPGEVLAALDHALAQAATETTPGYSTRPSASMVRTPEQAQQAVQAGFHSYRAGNYAAAEREFARLAASPETTAVHLYYLGLAQWREGKLADAEASFRRGWALERDSRPPPGEVEAAFERLDRADREAVNQFRR